MKSSSYDDSLSISENQGKNEYSLPDQLFAITCLESDQRVYAGELTPQYTKWSQVLTVPVTTLRNWYEKKKDLRKLAKAREVGFSSLLAAKLEDQAIRVFQELERRGLKKLSGSQLISLLKTDLTFSRILRGRSTQNVAHQHAFYTPPPPAKK